MNFRNCVALLSAAVMTCAAFAADAPAVEPAAAPATAGAAAPATTPAAAPATAAAAAAPATAPAAVAATTDEKPEVPVAPIGARIGVVMTAVPEVKVNIWGAGCLLCYGVASAANSSLSKHSKTLTAEDIPQLKQMVAERLRQQGFEVVVIDAPIVPGKLKKVKVKKGSTLAPRDYAGYKVEHGVDQLLVIDLSEVGFHRTYSAYVPTSDPKAAVIGSAYMVNLADGNLTWTHPVNILKSAESAWDEAPTFPGLTNAYYQALELAKDSILARIHL